MVVHVRAASSSRAVNVDMKLERDHGWVPPEMERENVTWHKMES
jgi:hypothetical protein